MLGAEVDLNVDVTAEDVVQAHRQRLKDAADTGYAFSQEVVPHDTGTLKASGFKPEYRGNSLVYGYQARHAAPLEFGTDPYYPPLAPLQRWAERIGKDAGFGWYVARKVIPEKGIQPSPYLRPSAEIMQQYLDRHGLDL